MPIPLSDRTIRLAEALFEEPMRSRVQDALIASVSESIPFCQDRLPEGMERIRFAVIKLIAQDAANFDKAIEEAKIDWRDLLMWAGFGHEVDEHLNWYRSVTERKT